MIGYKVARDLGGEYGPALVYAYQGIRYRIGETTTQGQTYGPMAVFNTQRAAEKFANGLNHLPHLRVLEVDYIKSTETALWWTTAGVKGSHFHPLRFCPRGTVLAESVTPLKVIPIRRNEHDPTSGEKEIE